MSDRQRTIARVESEGAARVGEPLVDSVADWLMDQALDETAVEDTFTGCCGRLYAAGVPLLRAHVAYHTLHPLYRAEGHVWQRGEALETERYAYVPDDPPTGWLHSPQYHMIQAGIPWLRRRLSGAEATIDFPILAELRDRGATDYLAYVVEFAPGSDDGIVGSWATDRASGFSPQDIAALMRIQHRLAVACKVTIKTQIARNVVATYLGPEAGLRVLDGQISRGDGETRRAVIWYSDLRGSTAMADRLPPESYLAVLNSYFEATAGAVLAAGGQILDFIGDAVLAIFPMAPGGADAAAACEKAMAAVRAAGARLAAVNAARRVDGDEPLAFGLALHVGEVMYGNIGVPDRLTFSVVGRTVNEVARLEALTKDLGRPVLVSDAFACNLADGWRSLGRHALPGVGAAIEVFAPAGD